MQIAIISVIIVVVVALICGSIYISSTAVSVTDKPHVQSDDLPQPQPQPLAQRIHQLVNEERARHGLASLSWDGRTATYAEAHANDILIRGSYADLQDPKDKGDIFYRGIENALCINEMNQQRIEINSRSSDEIARQVVEGWLADDYSGSNMLGPYAGEGIGAALDIENNVAVVVQNLC